MSSDGSIFAPAIGDDHTLQFFISIFKTIRNTLLEMICVFATVIFWHIDFKTNR